MKSEEIEKKLMKLYLQTVYKRVERKYGKVSDDTLSRFVAEEGKEFNYRTFRKLNLRKIVDS